MAVAALLAEPKALNVRQTFLNNDNKNTPDDNATIFTEGTPPKVCDLCAAPGGKSTQIAGMLLIRLWLMLHAQVKECSEKTKQQ